MNWCKPPWSPVHQCSQNVCQTSARIAEYCCVSTVCCRETPGMFWSHELTLQAPSVSASKSRCSLTASANSHTQLDGHQLQQQKVSAVNWLTGKNGPVCGIKNLKIVTENSRHLQVTQASLHGYTYIPHFLGAVGPKRSMNDNHEYNFTVQIWKEFKRRIMSQIKLMKNICSGVKEILAAISFDANTNLPAFTKAWIDLDSTVSKVLLSTQTHWLTVE